MESLLKAGQSFLGGGGGGSSEGQSGGSGSSGGLPFDLSSLTQHAQDHDQAGSGDSSLFGQATSFLQNDSGAQDGQVDEQELMNSANKVQQGDSAHSNEIGQAAALGAIKNFIGSNEGSGSSSSGGGFQQKIIGMAMAHASQMFDQANANGQVSGGDKQSAVNQAAAAATKLLIKHQVSGMIGGGGGGLGSLASMLM